ncbi:MAG: restriction endonuclease PLD domain-containing protein [Thermodesulfovibrionales bacterium]
MLFYENLEEIIFNRHSLIASDELIILSGYVGPKPVERLSSLPLDCKVIYGMYGQERIKERLHATLLNLHNSVTNLNIYYSTTPVHSKCYVWRRNSSVVHALIGSANFTSYGLSSPFKEVLAETSVDTFAPLNTYLGTVLRNSIECSGTVVTVGPAPRTVTVPQPKTDYCRMTLLDPRTGEVQNVNGLNWGQNPLNHTNRNDANIPLRAEHIRKYPNLFLPKQDYPVLGDARGRRRHNDAIDIIWDDGRTMEGLLEGNYEIDGVKYPKQISSFPEKRVLGEYIRRRIGVPLGARVTRRHLENYGRTHIDVSLQGEGIYYFDFSVQRG